MAYEYRAEGRRLLVSGSLPWPERAAPLAGVVWGVLLGLEGRTLLHGACLELGGSSYALLGGSGHGKSTLAAALVRQGATLVSEDLLVAERSSGGWRAEPGAPALHLLADSYAELEGGGSALALRDGKHVLPLPVAAAATPLAGLWILEPPGAAATSGLTALSGRRAVQRLLGHLYGAAWIRPAGQADLRFCADLVADLPVHAVARPWRLDRVADTAALLRRHALATPCRPGKTPCPSSST